jgi:glucose/arabinose dehydrogenase
VVERLEERLLLSAAPFTLGGDPVVDPADFRSTTFASGLNNPFSMQQLSDGSLLVGTSTTSSFGSAGQLVRLVDGDQNGMADGAGTVLYGGLPARVTSVRLAGSLVFVNSAGSSITVLRQGATPASPFTLVGSINYTYPQGFEHVTHTLAVRPTPGQPGKYDVFFNLGAATNADETTLNVPISGLLTGNLAGDAIHMFTVDNTGPNPVFSNLTQIATGVRNPGGFAFHPVTGDLYFSENGIDGLVDRNEPLSADELNRIAAADIGGAIEDFGFPNNYIQYRTGIEIGSGGIDPLYAFQPLPNPMGGAALESEGPVEIAFAPASFPGGLNNGVFVTFHGKGSVGVANEENPLVFASLASTRYFHIISNQEPAVGPIDTILATADSIYLADFRGSGAGMIYQVKVISGGDPENESPQVAAPISDLTVPENSSPVLNHADLNAVFHDPDNPDSQLVYSITANAPSGIVTATIGADDTLDLSFVANKNGVVDVTVRATDPGSLFAEDTFRVTVTAVNTAPHVANQIQNLTVPKNSPPVLDYVDLNAVFDDVDNPDSDLAYTVVGNLPSGIVTASIGADDKLDLSFVNGVSGVVVITVRATDPGGLFAQEGFVVSVTPDNAPPEVANPIPDLTVARNAPPRLDYVNLNTVFQDPDHLDSQLSYSIVANTPSGIVTASIGGDDTLDLSFVAGASGVVTITVVAVDPGFLSATDTFQVTVSASVTSETIGLYQAATGRFYFNTTNLPGPADLVVDFGPQNSNWVALSGDWNGNGVQTPGLYDPVTSTFYLRTTNTSGSANIVFSFGTGGAGWVPVAGDWNGNGIDSPGLYDPVSGQFYLRYFSAAGRADVVFRYGPRDSDWVPVGGDWDGNGVDTVGLFNPVSGTFFLRNSNTAGFADTAFRYGPAGAGWVPLAADWDGDFIDTVGLYAQTSAIFYLKNDHSPGVADAIIRYGPKNNNWLPLAGDWNGPVGLPAATASMLDLAGGAIASRAGFVEETFSDNVHVLPLGASSIVPTARRQAIAGSLQPGPIASDSRSDTATSQPGSGSNAKPAAAANSPVNAGDEIVDIALAELMSEFPSGLVVGTGNVAI